MAKYLLIYILWLLCKIWFTVHWIYILYCRNFHFFLLHFFGKLRNVFNHRRLCKTKEGKNLDGILRVETLFLPPLDFQPKPLEQERIFHAYSWQPIGLLQKSQKSYSRNIFTSRAAAESYVGVGGGGGGRGGDVLLFCV